MISKGKGQQTVAGKDRIGLAIGNVHRRLAAAKIVVIHGGKVVVNQRIAVNAFERCADAQGGLPVAAEKGGAFHHQKGPQTLAAIQDTVAHCGEERCGPGDFVRLRLFTENAGQARIDLCGAGLQADFEGCLAHAALIWHDCAPGWQRDFTISAFPSALAGVACCALPRKPFNFIPALVL